MTISKKVLCGFAALLMNASAVLAGNPSSPVPPSTIRVGAPPPVFPSLVLVSTKILTSTNPSITALGAGFQNVDAGLNFNCTEVCTLGAEQMLQISGSTSSTNQFAICTKVDGNLLTTPSCPFGGFVPVTGFLSANGSQTAFNLPMGIHRIQTQIYSDTGVKVSNWNFIYRRYK